MAATLVQLILCAVLIGTSFFLVVRIGTDEVHMQRVLSASFDIFTNETLRTYDGQIPIVSCPLGHYRPASNLRSNKAADGSTFLSSNLDSNTGTEIHASKLNGQRQDGCVACSRGKYGSETGLISEKCSGFCPPGTYGDKTGLKSMEECQLCPPGTYTEQRGTTGSTTSNRCHLCPVGKYSDTSGNTRRSSCIPCPHGYHGWQCDRTIAK